MSAKVKQLAPTIAAYVMVIGLLVAAIIIAIGSPIELPEQGSALSPGTEEFWPDMRIEINSANAAEFGLLPGIGPQLAQRIIDDRQERGRFHDVEQLGRVRGIGPVIMSRVRPFVVCE